MGRTMNIKDKFLMCKEWVVARVKERTSWDGATIVCGSALILLGAPIIKMLAWPALIWGVYTLVKEQS